MKTVLDALNGGTVYLEKRGIEDARRTMQLILAQQLGCDRIGLYMQFDRPLAEEALVPMREMLRRKGLGEPLQHILGEVEFCGRKFKSDARALVPRPETEELVEFLLGKIAPNHASKKNPALEQSHAKFLTSNLPKAENAEAESNFKSHAKSIDSDDFFAQKIPVKLEKPDVSAKLPEISEVVPELAEAKSEPEIQSKGRALDMGTGSGVIATTLALVFSPNWNVVAADISEDALSLARENATKLGAAVEFVKSDLFQAVSGRFDLVVANLPYISENERDELSKEVLFDPALALFGGKTGMEIISRFFKEIPFFLNPGALVALEVGYDQGEKTCQLMKDLGWQEVELREDLSGVARFPVGKVPI